MRFDRAVRRDERLSLVAEVYGLGGVRPEWFTTGTFAAAGACALCSMEPGAAPSIIATEGAGRTDLTAAWWDGPGMSERIDALLDGLCDALFPAGVAPDG